MNSEQLAQAAGCTPAIAEKWFQHLVSAMAKYNIGTPARKAAFIAQISHESGRFSAIEEDLNYSAEGLLKTFHTHFTAADAQRYAHHPMLIANRAYADRMGNGNEASGDGWKYRGRGLIQITGRDEYKVCGADLGLNLTDNPDPLLFPRYAALSAAWYWSVNGCNELADLDHFSAITKKINGGLEGQADRLALFAKAEAVFA
jgi:putative chitinase